MKRGSLIALAAALWLVAGPALAADFLGRFEAWEAYATKDGTDKVCFIASAPQKAVGNYTRRGETYVLVTHRPKAFEEGIVSVTAGYTFQKKSTPKILIGKKNFSMFTAGENAFVEEGDDPALVKAMIGGANMVVKGTSSRGTETTDTYSLAGFTAAYKAIGTACGL